MFCMPHYLDLSPQIHLLRPIFFMILQLYFFFFFLVKSLPFVSFSLWSVHMPRRQQCISQFFLCLLNPSLMNHSSFKDWNWYPRASFSPGLFTAGRSVISFPPWVESTVWKSKVSHLVHDQCIQLFLHHNAPWESPMMKHVMDACSTKHKLMKAHNIPCSGLQGPSEHLFLLKSFFQSQAWPPHPFQKFLFVQKWPLLLLKHWMQIRFSQHMSLTWHIITPSLSSFP